MKVIGILICIVAVLSIGLGYYVYTSRISEEKKTPVGMGTTTNNVTLPTATLTLQKKGGGEVSVKDFRNDPTTQTAPQMQGYFFLSGGIDPSGSGASYSISYNERYQSFNLTLLKEPLITERQNAERELQRILGLDDEVMCQINYDIGAPAFVNRELAGQNLGFSFCPGSVELPL